MISSLEKAAEVHKFGGKAANLSILFKNNFPVPPGWAVSFNSFDKKGSLISPGMLQIDKTKLYAIRSSASVEDSAEKSWAGQFETFLFVKPEDVVSKIEKCHKSSNDRTKAYAKEARLTQDIKISVIVQEMINPKYAGVVFTNNPVNGRDELFVEYVEGVGEQLVGGSKTPEQFVWDRSSKKVTSGTSVFNVDELTKQSIKIEKIFKNIPQDIEWAIDNAGKLWLLQTRPITTLKNLSKSTQKLPPKQKSGDDLSKLYETQIAFTEWIERIKHPDIKKIRSEVARKRERLAVVGNIIPFPSDTPTKFDAVDLTNRSAKLKKFLREHGEELCALRLVPKKGLHKEILRNRGKKIIDAMKWYDSLNINPEDYTIEFVPHMETNDWSTIIVVNDKGIFGEITNDGHYVLTQGFDGVGLRHTFSFDFKNWKIFPENEEALEHLIKAVKYLKVDSKESQKLLIDKVDAKFTNSYLKGYFETVYSVDVGMWFIDYDRMLPALYESYVPAYSQSSDSEIQGQVACSPSESVRGKVRIVQKLEGVKLGKNEILVCKMTSPDYIPLMQQAVAIVTDQGGILCHAAIVARELNKPCIVATSNATSLLKTGEEVELDMVTGAIHKLDTKNNTTKQPKPL